MIKFKKLSWSNAFSYGPNNSLQLDEDSLTQLVGKNGNGKSSIALILEEVLFNTNSKKIKKGDVLNRYTNSKNYVINLDFNVDECEYSISTTRTASSGSVKLMRNGTDISSHTSTGTYKQIEQIIGYDHKTFSQIVYQSSVSSLEFLTATDTARKKFLIELLNLTKYTKALDVFKELASGVSKQLDITNAKVNTVKDWLAKYANTDLSLRSIEEELASPVSIVARITELKNELANIESTNASITKSNKGITQNNTYVKVLAGLVVLPKPETPKDSSYLVDLQAQVLMKQKVLNEGRALSGTTAMSTCKTCNQAIDNSTRFKLAQNFESNRQYVEKEILELSTAIASHQLRVKEYTAYLASVAEYEKYTGLVDVTMSKVLVPLLDADILYSEIKLLQDSVNAIEMSIAKTRNANKAAETHNTKVGIIIEQMAEMNSDLKVLSATANTLAKELATLQVLVKSFSSTGLVAYKIESLIKDLEDTTNEYLGLMSDGRFQLSFKIASSDKLNVVITDNGRDISIEALSMGERARVNVSTLLAIRKLMQALSNSRTNLLILDETISNLDTEGKERLIEVLLAEESLNTFLIAHDYNHPLLEKIEVVKENNVSRLDK